MKKILKKNVTLRSLFMIMMLAFLTSCGGECHKTHCDDAECKKCEDCVVVECKTNEDKLKEIIDENTKPINTTIKSYLRYAERNNAINDFVKRKYKINYEDTREIYFDFEKLKEYIRYVEEQSLNIKVKPEGIKVVLSVNSDNPKDTMSFKTNVFLVPTIKDLSIKGSFKQSAYYIDNKEVVFYRNSLDKGNTIENQGKPQKAGFFSFYNNYLNPTTLTLEGDRPIPPPKINGF